MTTTIKRRIVRAGGWGLAMRLIKPIPIIGSVFALGLAAFEIKKKGLIPGAVHVGLDVTPVVGTAKNVVEIFTGDWIPDKPDRNKKITPQQLALPDQTEQDRPQIGTELRG
jgi:hypothetical protein